MMASSIYKSLDAGRREIRLLHLLPVDSARPAEIHCEISVTTLNRLKHMGKRPKFEALSYAWGDRNDTETIFIRDRDSKSSKPSPLRITRNLHVALSNIRFTDRERTLWIDAVSINQDDEGEKATQVALMKDIYKGASQVVVFLGSSSEETDRAMDFIECASNHRDSHVDPSKSPHLEVQGMDLESTKLRDDLVNFFDMPWWCRVWTVQEFALARSVVFQCGLRTMENDTMKTGWKNMMYHGDACCYNEYLTMKINPELKANVGVWDAFIRYDALLWLQDGILSNIVRFLSRVSYDSRDKIYGMLGLASKAEAALISADYDSSVEEVFERFVMVTINETGFLDIMSFGSQNRNIDSLPSYISDFTATYDDLTVSRLFYRFNMLPLYKASGKSRAKWKSAGPKRVAVQGLLFDEIVKTGPNFKKSSDRLYDEIEQAIKKLDALTDTAADEPGDGRQRMPSHIAKTSWQTLIGGIAPKLQDGDDARATDEDYETYQYVRSDVLELEDAKEPQTDDEANKVDWFWRRVRTAVVGPRTFITTKKGFVGLASSNAEKGDYVAVLAGGRTPYILREGARSTDEDSKASTYSFVGDAYVHGIMDGEVFGLLDRKDGAFEEIILV